MFFFLSKILSFIITPIIWIIGLFIYSFVTKIESRKKKARVWSLILLLFFSNSAIFNFVMNAWEVPAIKTSELKKHEIAIVLGGILSVDSKLDRIQFANGNDRLMQAIDLYHKGIINKIFFVGGSGSIAHPDFKEAVYVRKYLLGLGIADSNIIIESESKNTRENAVNAKKIIDETRLNSNFILITSAFHMRRSLGCFEKVNIVATPYSADRMSGPVKWDIDFWLIPDAEAIQNWDILIHEWVGYITYKLLGYI